MKTAFAWHSRSAQVVVLFVAVALPVALIALALTADVGQMVVVRARLQNAADAAALAGAQVLSSSHASGDAETVARQHALSVATDVQQANSPDAGINVQFGVADESGAFAAAAADTEATAVKVTCVRNESAPGGNLKLLFAPIFGMNSAAAQATATAQVASNIRGVLSGLSPFAVPASALVAPGEEMTFYPDDDDTPEGDAAGNWGLLDLNGGSNGVPDLARWILYGYDGEFVIGDDGYLWIDGNPGLEVSLKDEITQRIGHRMIMVVYDQLTGYGANAQYRCIGFVNATILTCKLTGKNKNATCRVDHVTGLHGLVVGGTNESVNIRKIQLVK